MNEKNVYAEMLKKEAEQRNKDNKKSEPLLPFYN